MRVRKKIYIKSTPKVTVKYTQEIHIRTRSKPCPEVSKKSFHINLNNILILMQEDVISINYVHFENDGGKGGGAWAGTVDSILCNLHSKICLVEI
jgi:hypothetical protein